MCGCVRVCAGCVKFVENVTEGSARFSGSSRQTPLLLASVLSIVHPGDSRFCLVAKGPQLNVSESVTLVVPHLRGARVER